MTPTSSDSAKSRSRRVFPIPASPDTTTARPCASDGGDLVAQGIEIRLPADEGNAADLHTAHHPTSLVPEALRADREESLSPVVSCGGPAPCS